MVFNVSSLKLHVLPVAQPPRPGPHDWPAFRVFWQTQSLKSALAAHVLPVTQFSVLPKHDAPSAMVPVLCTTQLPVASQVWSALQVPHVPPQPLGPQVLAAH